MNTEFVLFPYAESVLSIEKPSAKIKGKQEAVRELLEKFELTRKYETYAKYQESLRQMKTGKYKSLTLLVSEREWTGKEKEMEVTFMATTPPFRYGGFEGKFENTAKDWLESLPEDWLEKDKKRYCECSICKRKYEMSEHLYAAHLTVVDESTVFPKGRIMLCCKKCAYDFNLGVVEPDGEVHI